MTNKNVIYIMKIIHIAAKHAFLMIVIIALNAPAIVKSIKMN